MELRRVFGRLAPRWPVLLIAGLIGAVGAFIFVQNQNSEVEPVYRAEATLEITVAETGGDARGSSSTISEELSEALELAKITNEIQIRTTSAYIEPDSVTNSLLFGSVESTEEEAVAVVNQMRTKYIDADPNFDVAAELAAKLDEAALISDRLDELLPEPPIVVPPTPEEAAATEATLAPLQAREAAIRAEISTLATERISAETDEEIEDIDTQIAVLSEDLRVLLVVLNPLEAAAAEAAEAAATADNETDTSGEGVVGQDGVASDNLPIADQWAIQALTERLATLQTESAELIVASVTGASLELPGPEVTDESPSALPPWLGLVVGFLAGAAIWSAVLLAFDRARGIVWQAGDVKNVVVLAEAPAAALESGELTDIERQRRKRSVQALRSAIIASREMDQGTVVGFAAPPSTEPGLRDALAYDVAASIASVGRSVLVVDLGFNSKESNAYGWADQSGLRDLFDAVNDDEETIRQRADAAIASAETLGLGLDVLVADSDVIDPADILAGRPVSELLEQGQQRFDVVVVIQPNTSAAPGTGIDGYLQQQIIVCTRGKTRAAEIAAESIQQNAQGVQMVGVAILVPVTGGDRSRRGSGGLGGRHEDRDTSRVLDYDDEASGGRRVTSAIRRIGANEQPARETTIERLRSLENYSVEESALLRGSESPTDSA